MHTSARMIWQAEQNMWLTRLRVCACQAGGYLGVATGAIAWYVATAELTNEVYRKVSAKLTYESHYPGSFLSIASLSCVKDEFNAGYL
jgi:hypothetical protein